MADVLEINNLEDLEPYRLAWNALLPKTPRASFFHTFEWLENFWKHFGADRQLRVLIIRSQGSVIGIVPLCVQQERYQIGTVNVLTYPLSDWGSWYGPIGPNQAACLHMALNHIQNTPRDWDMIDLRWIDSNTSQASLSRSFKTAELNAEITDYQSMSIIDFDDNDWESYRANLPKKWRHEIGRQGRVLEREYSVEFKRHRPLATAHGDGSANWSLFDDCLQISKQSWQANSTTGNTLCHPEVSDFISDSHETAAHLGMLDVAVLKLDGKPAAYQYNYIYRGRLYGLRMGFDRKYAKQGVGKVLMSRLIEDSFQRGDISIDMGIGDFDFKRKFRSHVDTSQRVCCYPWNAWRSQGVRLTRWVKSRVGKEALPAKAN